jgi:TatD DNase family protein
MIDTHCHLEQSDYAKDRDLVIKECKKQLKAVITSCAHPKDFEVTMHLVNKYKNFVFATISIHPEYVKDFRDEEIENFLKRIKSNKDNIVGVGETGLDYNWVKEVVWREKQKILFKKFISLAKDLKLPLVIHSRDATEDTLKILEGLNVQRAHLHMFTKYSVLDQVIDNGWYLSFNTLLLKSKNVQKIVKHCPLEQMMLETDAPWLGVDANHNIKPKNVLRNKPIAVKLVAEKISKIKKLDYTEVSNQLTENAIFFYKLNI